MVLDSAKGVELFLVSYAQHSYDLDAVLRLLAVEVVVEYSEGSFGLALNLLDECGACRIVCFNVGWKYPRGGFGVSCKYG